VFDEYVGRWTQCGAGCSVVWRSIFSARLLSYVCCHGRPRQVSYATTLCLRKNAQTL